MANQLNSIPIASSGIAAVPWAAISAPSRNSIWLLPPIAIAVVPSHPIVRGWAWGVTSVSFGDVLSAEDARKHTR